MFLLTILAVALVALAFYPRRAVAIVAAAIVIFAPSMALAETVDATDSVGQIRLSAFVVSILISVFIPIFTAIVTKLSTDSKVKGYVTLAGNFIATSIVTWKVADGSAVFSKETLATALIGFVISTASYWGLYGDINAKLLPDKGI